MFFSWSSFWTWLYWNKHCLWALVVLIVCESISLIIGRTCHCKHRLVFSYHETVAVVFVQVRRTSGNTVLLKLSVISLITGSMRKFTLPGTQNGSCYFHNIACDLKHYDMIIPNASTKCFCVLLVCPSL